MKRIWFWLALLGIMLLLGGCGRKKTGLQQVPPVVAEEEELEEEIDPEFLADQQVVREVLARERGWGGANPTVLVVRKQSRQLSVFKGTKPVKMFPVVLGHNPRNDKLEQGDKCTPEGVYRVVSKYPHPKWSKFILLNYPTQANWLKFADAKRRGQIPIDAQIGGDIGIHGTEYDYKNILGENWTLGCISLKNKDIGELYRLVQTGSIVVIQRK
jgi:lipoprotein-anchoring transpeptidase ErfK/SrfK